MENLCVENTAVYPEDTVSFITLTKTLNWVSSRLATPKVLKSQRLKSNRELFKNSSSSLKQLTCFKIATRSFMFAHFTVTSAMFFA